jgi:hypothetical protein
MMDISKISVHYIFVIKMQHAVKQNLNFLTYYLEELLASKG